MIHVSHSFWRVLIVVGTAVIMLMLAEVAAAEDKLDREALQPPSPIEKAIAPPSGIAPTLHRAG